jgi:hypothetical protein
VICEPSREKVRQFGLELTSPSSQHWAEKKNQQETSETMILPSIVMYLIMILQGVSAKK